MIIMPPQYEQNEAESSKTKPQTQTCDQGCLLAFEQRYGVDVARQGEKFTYKLHGGSGQDILDFSTSSTPAGLMRAGSILSRRVSDKESELSVKFHVEFSQDGEYAAHQQIRDAGGKYIEGKLIQARSPKLNELVGIEAALSRSRPSQLQKSDHDKGVKFYFLTSRYVSDEKSIAHFDQSDLNRQPAILVDPERLPGNFHLRQVRRNQSRGARQQKTVETFISRMSWYTMASPIWAGH